VNLQGKLVLVTGASSGIGAAAARQFAAKGARVLLLARSREALEAVAASIRHAGGTADLFPLDLSDLDAIGQAATQITGALGVPDVLVNNAGAGRWLGVEETTPHDVHAMMQVPYVGAAALTAALAGGMLRRGSGQIVNVTSPAAFTPFPGAVAYSVARAAMMAFTTALQVDLRGTGVGASLVVCGETESDYFANNPGTRERIPRIGRLYPVLTPEQAGAAIVRAAETGARRIVVPLAMRWTLWMWSVAPWLVQALVNATGHRRAYVTETGKLPAI